MGRVRNASSKPILGVSCVNNAAIKNSLNTSHSALNLGFIFDKYLLKPNYISPQSLLLSYSCHITPVLRSLHWLKITKRIASNTSSSHLPIKFSQPPSLHTFITSSLFNVLAALALHPSLLLLGHRHHSR